MARVVGVNGRYAFVARDDILEIIDISNTGPGQRPIVTFSLSNKWGPLPPDYLGRLRFSLSGPNDDFSFYAQDDALDALVADGADEVAAFSGEAPVLRDDYAPVDHGVRAYDGDKRILVLCTEERYFEMTNGNLFSTGQNAQETAVPLMHLTSAGFDNEPAFLFAQ